MLQIINGKFYTDETRRSNLLRGTLYSNMSPPWRCEPIETVAGKLLPSTIFRGLRTLTYEVVEEYEGAPEVGLIVSVGADPFLQDFAAITSFALNLICTPDPDLLRRLVGDRPLSPSVIAAPQKYVGRVFDAEANVGEADLTEFKDFVAELIALKRSSYLVAIGAIRTYVTGLHRIADDLDLAYTLLVASIEALAQHFHSTPPVWDDYAEHKRGAIDKALKGAPTESQEKVRQALLKVEHVALARKFRSFALENVGASFFREEAVGEVRPVGRADLIEAVAQAYAIRSRYVHGLEPIPRQVSHVWDLSNTVSSDGKPVLTLHGLARLARHLIFAFVRQAPRVSKETYAYQRDFPGTVTVEMAAQYWVWKHEGFKPAHARQKLGGYLELIAALHTQTPQPALTDIRDLLRKYEDMIPKAKGVERLSMVALYALFNVLVPEEDRLEGWRTVVARYESALGPPSLEGLAVRLGLNRSLEWSAADTASLYESYYAQKYKKNRLELPGFYESAFALALAEAHRKEGSIVAAQETLRRALENQPTMAILKRVLDDLNADNDAEISWQKLLLPPMTLPKPPERAGSEASVEM